MGTLFFLMALSTVTRVGRHAVTFVEATINLASINAGAIDASNDVVVPGANPGDTVNVNWTNEAAALVIRGYVSAPGIVTVVATNSTAGAVNADSATFYIAVHHRP